MTESVTVPGWPVITIELSADGLTVDGEPLFVPPGSSPRETAIASVARTAQTLGRPVRTEAIEEDGTVYPLTVAPDGRVAEAGPPIPATTSKRGAARRKSAPNRPTSPIRQQPVPMRVDTPGVQAASASAALSAPPSPAVPAPVVVSEPAPAVVSQPVPAEPTALPVAPSASGIREDAPAPTTEQSAAVRAIHAAFEAGQPKRALELADDLERETARGGSPSTVLAAREVHAYAALQAGSTERAVELFAEAAVARVRDENGAGHGVTSPDRWAWRLVQNAHYCWLRVEDVESAYAVSSLVLGAYAALGAADGAAGQTAKGYQEELRRRLRLG